MMTLDDGGKDDLGFDHFLVLDFEATCIKDMRINPQEVIEFPCLRVDARTMEIEQHGEALFHSYVQPVYIPKLSPFCIKLTGKKELVEVKIRKKSISRFGTSHLQE